MENPSGSEIIKDWPEESQEAAQLVIDTYGEPQEATGSLPTWHQVGPWKRVLASRVFFEHEFPHTRPEQRIDRMNRAGGAYRHG